MSAFAEFETKITSQEFILAALAALGYTTVETHETPAHLIGYMGDTRDTVAHIIVRRKYIGEASNDLGFLRMEDGTYKAIISDYDSQGELGVKWLGRLKQSYQEHRQMAVARQKGYRFIGRSVTEKGEVRLQFTAR